MESLEVCSVVNAVGQGSIPADIATAVTRTTDHNVDIVTWFHSEDFAGSDIVSVYNIDAPSTTLGIDRATYRRARKRLRGYDVVQANHNHAGAFAKVIAYRLGIPLISREGNTRDGFTVKGRVANGLTNPLADRVVCISESVYRSFRQWERLLLSDEAVEIVPNGVDPERIQSAAGEGFLRDQRTHDDSFVVANAAMLYEQKAQDVLIQAVALANEAADRPIELFIAGRGPRRERLESFIDDLGIADLVHFLGYVPREDVYAMLSTADLFAMPSRWEGFCVAVAEALAAGVPCVLSDIDVFQELFGDAAVFHPVDDPNALASHFISLMEDELRREQLATEGRNLISAEYDIEVVARRYADIYEEIT